MATKDITDKQVCEAFRDRVMVSMEHECRFPYDILEERTGQAFKVCWRAMERAADRGLIEYGVSLRTGWLTERGRALLSDFVTSTG